MDTTPEKPPQTKDMFPGAMPDTIGRNDLAKLLGITPMRITQLKGEGLPVAPGHGRFPLAGAVQWWVNYWKTKNSMTTKGVELDSHRRRLLKAQAKKAEIDNDIRLKELIPAEKVRSTFNQVSVIIASQLDSLAPRLANELTNQTESSYVKKVINDETRQIRNAVANQFDDFSNTHDRGNDSQAAAD